MVVGMATRERVARESKGRGRGRGGSGCLTHIPRPLHAAFLAACYSLALLPAALLLPAARSARIQHAVQHSIYSRPCYSLACYSLALLPAA